MPPQQKGPSLKAIVAQRRTALEARKALVPLAAVRAQAEIQQRRNRPRDVVSRLRDGSLSVVALVQKASPYAGRLFDAYDPVNLARLFERSGAAAISVSTESHYHKGGVEHLTVVKEAVQVPVWCHDYIIDTYQIYEIRAAGADGLMLIPALLDDEALREFVSLTQRLKMTTLVMVRSAEDVARVLRVEPRMVGIACRDWETTAVDLSLPALLRPMLPAHTTVIAVGGLHTEADARRMVEAGVDGILMGEALLTSADAADKIRTFASLTTHPLRFRRSPS